MRAPRRFGITVLGLGALAVLACGPAVSRAALMLTPAGVSQGFSLTTFATGFPTNGVGPLGIAFPSTGGVLVTDDPGNIRLFATDTNGQSAASAPVTQNYGGGNAIGLAQVGGHIYMTQQAAGNLVQVNNNGTFNQLIASGMPLATGLVADPTTGHLFVSTVGFGTIFDVDPIAKTKTAFVNVNADGLSISPDNKTLFAEVNNSEILGFDIATKALVFNSGFIPGSPDGTAAGTGSLAPFIFVNTNGGTVVEVNLATLVQTVIATGGSRGDFVTVDPNDGSLLLTQTDSIVRLIPPAGGGFGGTPTVPEPSTLALLMLGGVGLAGWRRWKRRATA